MNVLFIIAIGLAFFFSFWNGFTDAANAISTIVATRVLKPSQAVLLAAAGDFLGLFFGTAVAMTIGRGIVNEGLINSKFLIAALAGGLIFDVATWFWALPISESHVLIGSLVGAGLMAGGPGSVNKMGVFNKVAIPMVVSPLIAFIFAFLFISFVLRLFLRFSTTKINPYFRKLQIISCLFFSVNHGANDGQKVVGIVTVLLIQQGILNAFKPPFWLIIIVQATIAFGTLLGGWRIVKTVAKKITDLRPYQGFCAETGAALVLFACSRLGFPVSTTHAISGSIMGVGATRRISAVRWGVARNIVIAWILTMPLSALFSALIYLILDLFI